ncbi:hypothetical protein J2858_003777 [Neorhizobium galegae]|uniref:hypothetical protein n=1 Tax=Neorhizobium galegae TaxID=399 RepID=UPI001AEAF308|nr:hypothetical protein [Neorhizobium galegae]MBP2550837.1 hypothetical protein [Neorhizobium galegae]
MHMVDVQQATFQDNSQISKMVADLERMLRFSSITKTIEVPEKLIEDASLALAKARGMVAPPTSTAISDVEVSLLQAIDKLAPRIYPATPLSLEIAELMEGQMKGQSVHDADSREADIYKRVNRLIKKLMWFTVGSLIATILCFALTDILKNTLSAEHQNLLAPFKVHVRNAINVVVGLLGACAYILRSILTRLANQTFVLREESGYYLRMNLGMTLGFIMPQLIDSSHALSTINSFTIAFLAGYAVEAMFTALDTLVTTVRDAVARPTQTPVTR